jgi:hypothetical protein
MIYEKGYILRITKINSYKKERTFARRQFMRGTDPIKSRWECLRIVMLVAKNRVLILFYTYSNEVYFVGIRSY